VHLNLNHLLHQQVIEKVTAWLEAAVIGLGLCPFASSVYLGKKIRYTISKAESDEALLIDLYDECAYLIANAATETTLLIVPNHLNEFADFNEFQSLAESLLEQYGWIGIFQIASFHPQYQFADTRPEDRENSTNRSPYPILHLLREDSLSRAIAAHPAPENIPIANIKRLNSLDQATFNQIFALKPPVGE
jgi:hypothetical protein